MFGTLTSYLSSIRARDPAPRSRWEILTYPGVWAVGFHRLRISPCHGPGSPATPEP